MSIAHKLATSHLVTDEATGISLSVPKEAEALDAQEKELHARAMSVVDRALRNHGVSLNGKELQHIAAEIADFVIEHSGTAAKAEQVAPTKPKRNRRKSGASNRGEGNDGTTS